VEVALALWFHDAIYEPAGADSELQSAAWAARALAKAGVSSEVAQRVYDLVMATRHQAPVEGLDAQLLVDVDLAILGSPEARFLAYDSDIRKEFARVAEARYPGRSPRRFQPLPSGSRRSSPSRCGPRTRWRRGHRAARGRRAHAALAFQRRRRSATRLRRKRKPIGRGSRRSCPRWFSDLRDGCRATCGRRRILGTFGASRRTGQAAPLRTPAGRLHHRFALGEGQADIAWNWVRSISVQPHQLHSAHRSCIATVEFKNNRASHSTARSRDPRRKDSSKYAGVPPFLTASLLAQLVDLASSNKGLQHPLGAARD